MAELATRACNKHGLCEYTMCMHELWAASGCPTVPKLRRARKQRLREAPTAKRVRRDTAEPDVDNDISLDSDADIDLGP